MRTLQANEAKARITAFLAKLKASKDATVIRHNRPHPGMASMRGNAGESRANIGA